MSPVCPLQRGFTRGVRQGGGNLNKFTCWIISCLRQIPATLGLLAWVNAGTWVLGRALPRMNELVKLHALSLGIVSSRLLGTYMYQALNLKGIKASFISLFLKHNQFKEYSAQTSWLPSAYFFVRGRHLQWSGTMYPLVRLIAPALRTLYCNGNWETLSFGTDIS